MQSIGHIGDPKGKANSRRKVGAKPAREEHGLRLLASQDSVKVESFGGAHSPLAIDHMNYSKKSIYYRNLNGTLYYLIRVAPLSTNQ